MSHTNHGLSRRGFIVGSLGLASLASPAIALATTQSPLPARQLAMDHTHTGESLELVYAVGRRYVPAALENLNHFLRDHYTGQVGLMDPALYDIMHRVRQALKVRQPYAIISGYRAPETNERLRRKGSGGVARRSLHMDGKAVDIRIPGVPLAELRDAALSLKAGGVGYYPKSQFVHVDTGKVRQWNG